MKSPANSSRTWPIVAIVAVTLACYWPVAGFEFSTWDDGLNVTENPHFNPPRISHIGFFWTHPFQKLYIPVAYSVWMFVALAAHTHQADITGTALNPYIFHLANLLVHVLAVATAYQILRRLFVRDWAAALGAMLFAIHPLQVEPVTWVTGFRDVLCGLLSLVAIDRYIVAFDRREPTNPRRALHATLATLAYIAAMLAKPMAASLPLVAAVIDLMILSPRASTAGVFKAKIIKSCPGYFALLIWVLAAIPIIFISRQVQPLETHAIASPLWSRPLVAGDALTFYMSKLVAPVGLAMDYGRKPEVVLAHGWIYLSWLVPVSVGVVVWILRRRAPWLAAGAMISLAALLPILGLIPFAFQAFSTVGDRYMYVAMLGPSVVLAGFLCTARLRSACAVATIVILILAALAHRQVWFWRDDTVLYPHTIAINPTSYTANNNLAAVLLERGRPADAIPYARRACQLNPAFARTHVNLADALAAVGQPREAIESYRAALQIQPTHAAARAKLALALASVGQSEEARREFDRAVRDDPDQRRVEPQLMEMLREHR